MAQDIIVSKKETLTASDVRKQVNLIQEVMKSVMKKDEHYGIIPGCKKPSLFKPGAEKLCMTFRLEPNYEELPGSREEDSFIMYKIKCTLTHISSGNVVGHGVGACNSKEKKYKEYSVYANKATEEQKKLYRKETRQGNNGNYDVYMVPVDPWEIQNTLYKMACKRALIAAVLNATAASDIFAQDIEDLPEGILNEEGETSKSSKPVTERPKKKTDKPGTEKIHEDTNVPANDAQLHAIDLLQKKLSEEAIRRAMEKAGLEEGVTPTFAIASILITALGEEVRAKK